MQWIKRNLFFVIGGVVALMLMAVAVWFLLGKIQENNDIKEGDDGLNKQVSELQRLYSGDTFPSPENIETAKKEQQRIKVAQNDLRKLFGTVTTYPKMGDRAFKQLLVSSIAELQKEATNAGVMLPEKFSFTFTAQREMLEFKPDSIEPWQKQLADIKVLCGIIYKARVISLDALLRVPVSPDDSGTPEFLSMNITTNQLGVFTPYQISFRGFSGDIASVLREIVHSTNCIIVKNITITPSTAQPGEASPSMSMPVQAYIPAVRQPPAVSAAPDYLTRGSGRVPPSATAPVAANAARPPVNVPPVTVLKERPLQVTLLVEVVQLKPAP